MTASRDEKDIVKTYELHPNAYIQRPVDFNQFINAVRSIEGFWLSVVKHPSKT